MTQVEALSGDGMLKTLRHVSKGSKTTTEVQGPSATMMAFYEDIHHEIFVERLLSPLKRDRVEIWHSNFCT